MRKMLDINEVDEDKSAQAWDYRDLVAAIILHCICSLNV